MVMFINKNIVEEFDKKGWELDSPSLKGDRRETLYNRGLNVEIYGSETLIFRKKFNLSQILIILENSFGSRYDNDDALAQLDFEDLQLLNMVYREWGYLL